MEPVYVTPEQVMSALDVKPNAFMTKELLRACQSGSRSAEGYLHRIFYPEVMTRTFDYPSWGKGAGLNQIYFDEKSLISLTSAASGGINIPSGNVLLRPDNIGPPYEYVELNRDSSSSFSGGPQRSVSLTGLWGYRNDEVPAGTLVASPDIDPTATLVTLTTSLDLGTLFRVEQERMIVTAKRWTSTGIFAPALSSNKNDVTMIIGSAALFEAGEYIMIDSERMQVEEITGVVLTLRRATGGSVLAAHTAGQTIYWNRQHVVQRGALGTTAAYHGNNVAASQWVAPALAAELSQAYAEDAFLQRNAGYARTAGTGESERQVSGRSIQGIERRSYPLLGRKARVRAV